ncbi:hypothetical protein KEM54_002052 [Ascosphaera aggregata]|nr:hypothetical protein KEM54_002052 [Ascosphaera aggregata]
MPVHLLSPNLCPTEPSHQANTYTHSRLTLCGGDSSPDLTVGFQKEFNVTPEYMAPPARTSEEATTVLSNWLNSEMNMPFTTLTQSGSTKIAMPIIWLTASSHSAPRITAFRRPSRSQLESWFGSRGITRGCMLLLVTTKARYRNAVEAAQDTTLLRAPISTSMRLLSASRSEAKRASEAIDERREEVTVGQVEQKQYHKQLLSEIKIPQDETREKIREQHRISCGRRGYASAQHDDIRSVLDSWSTTVYGCEGK